MTGVDLLDGYGQAETLMTELNYPGTPVKPGSMGRPLPGVEAAVIDGHGRLRTRNAHGRLVLCLVGVKCGLLCGGLGYLAVSTARGLHGVWLELRTTLDNRHQAESDTGTVATALQHKEVTPMSLGNVHAITDVCILVEDVERTVRFYTEKLGFALRRRAEGFADFAGAGITLAAWEIGHIHIHTGVSGRRAPRGTHKACIAVELATRAILDTLYDELRSQGVPFQAPPKAYPWNAYCAYFTDPDDTLWELYVWGEGGPGDYQDSRSLAKAGNSEPGT